MMRLILVVAILTSIANSAHATALEDIAQATFLPHVEAGDIAGVAIAITRGDETAFVFLGKANLESGTPPGSDTLFEIGSITKVMTGTLLALALGNGDVALDTKVQDLLPKGNTAPTWEGNAITLQDLATHTSGLPRMPDNWHPTDPNQPYTDYHAEDLYTFLNNYKLPRAPGKRYEYSNLATALLGHLLALKANTPYETLLRDQLLTPLGMSATHTTPKSPPAASAATGYTATTRLLRGKKLEPRAMWEFDVFQPAGAARANIEDMAKFLGAAMSPPDSALGTAIRLAQEPRFTVNDQLALGLNWHLLTRPGKPTLTWHNGQTGGYHSFLGFDPKRNEGIVVLCNTDYDIDPAALQVLDKLASE